MLTSCNNVTIVLYDNIQYKKGATVMVTPVVVPMRYGQIMLTASRSDDFFAWM